MRLVVICCFGGRSSGFLCSRIMKNVLQDGTVVSDTLQKILKDYDGLSQAYNLALAYGSLSEIDAVSVREKMLGERIDQIWICPQACYMKATLDQILRPYRIPVNVMDRMIFGTMNAAMAWEAIMTKLYAYKEEERL